MKKTTISLRNACLALAFLAFGGSACATEMAEQALPPSPPALISETAQPTPMTDVKRVSQNEETPPTATPPLTEVPELREMPIPHLARTLSQDAIEKRVKDDLAAFLKVSLDQIQTLQVEKHTWQTPLQGCNPQKGLEEPDWIEGYLFILSGNGLTFEYHTDLHGEFVRCPAVNKPLDPIK